MAELYGQIITKIYHVKDGEGQYGKWRMWSLYLKDNDKKFTYFSGGKKPEPFEGMKIGYLKYTEKQETSKKDGKVYNNYTIDDLKVSEDSPQPQTGQGVPTKPQGRDFHAENFGKCKFGFLQQAFVPFIKSEICLDSSFGELEKLAETFATMSMRILSNTPSASQTAKELEDTPENAPEQEDPFQGDEVPLSAYEEG